MISKDFRKRPDDSDMKQQHLPMWKPILSDKFFYWLIFIIAVMFMSIGIPMVVKSGEVAEFKYDYTNCKDVTTGIACSDLLGKYDKNYTADHSKAFTRCQCKIPVNLTGFKDKDNIFLMYNLGGFFQDHRKYISSRWDAQLSSEVIGGGKDCEPLLVDSVGLPYAPCGEIANSMFNDTFKLFTNANETVVLSGKNIAWPSDVQTRYNNPTVKNISYANIPHDASVLCDLLPWLDTSVAKPKNWPVRACQLGSTVAGVYNPWSPEFNSNGFGYENEDFMVWMRVESSGNFRKLHRVIKTPLPDGFYSMMIDYNFPVASFSGTKSFVISSTSWIGGKNPFLGMHAVVT